MSDKSNQNISELMDGEFDTNSSQFLLKRMLSDEQLSRTWSRYHLIRNYLQKDKDAPFVSDLGAKVCRQLGTQAQTEGTSSPRLHNRWLKPILGSAIAASVAFVAVVMFQNNTLIGSNQSTATLIAENTKTANQLVEPPAARLARSENTRVLTRYPSLSPQVETYLNGRNIQSIEQYPFYYNQEYLRELQNQIKQVDQQQTAE